MKFVVGALALLFASQSFAMSVDPDVHWRVLVTPHFDIFYDRDHKDLAEEYGIAAEQAYDILRTNRFSEAPEKTYIILSDNTDMANGGATFLPSPMIQIFPVMPDNITTLDYYGNWPLEMTTHEYTHILNFQPSHGWVAPFRYTFGSIVHPNGLLPRWYLEGLAVESETRFSDWGRLKSPRAFAEYRAFVEAGTLRKEDIARINEVMIPEYPFGERPYIFGALLWEHMAQFGPPNVVDRLNQEYGRRFPFIINSPVKRIYDQKYDQLLSSAYTKLEAEVHKQFEEIEKKKKESFTKFRDDEKMEQFQPAISPDGGKLIYIANSFHKGHIRLIERSGNESFSGLKSKKLHNISGTLRLSWMPDSQSFVFDAVNEMSHFHTYRELYRYDLHTKRITRLTTEQRAQEPGVSPDGRLIAFVQNGSGRQSIALLDLSNNNIRTIFAGALAERVSHPEFISDHEFVFTARNVKGEERLNLVNLSGDQRRELFQPAQELRRPRWTSLGLLVATTESGVENLAIADLKTQKLRPLTNTKTEMPSGDFDSRTKELIATRFTGDGPKLVATQAGDEQPPKIGSNVTAKWPKPPTPKTIDKSEFHDESFQPIPYMWPRYWIPFIYPVYGGAFFQGSTAMSDPTGINSYAATVSYDTVTNHGSFGLQYVNASLPPDISLSYVKAENYLGASGWMVQEQTATGALDFFLPYLSPHWKMGVGYMTDQIDSTFDTRIHRQGPLARLNFSNWADSRNEGAGTILEFGFDQFLPGPNQFEYYRGIAGFQQAWRQWLPNGHRVVLTGKSAFAPDLPFQHVVSVGDSSLGANYLVSLSNAQFLFRGYNTGEFVGRKVLNWNLEYQFPVSKNTWGSGTTPWFSRGLDAAIFFDGLSVDGGSYDVGQDVYFKRGLGDFALSTGAEARWNVTAFYEMPLTVIYGLYFGFDDLAHNTVMPFLGIALTDISNIDHLKKNWFKHF